MPSGHVPVPEQELPLPEIAEPEMPEEELPELEVIDLTESPEDILEHPFFEPSAEPDTVVELPKEIPEVPEVPEPAPVEALPEADIVLLCFM